MAPFQFFWVGLYSPKYCLILLKSWPEVVYNKTNRVFEKFFKILNFGSNEIQPKFTVLDNFGAQFTTRKLKILLKSKISPKTARFLSVSDHFKKLQSKG